MAHLTVLVKAPDGPACTGDPIEGVTVSVVGKKWDGTTDSDGKFDFGDHPPGTYTVKGKKDGCTPASASQTQSAPAGTDTQYNLTLNPPCKFNIIGPADVPGLSKYKYQIDLPSDKTASNISWSVDKPGAGLEGPTTDATVVVTFNNDAAAWITLKATFTLDGKCECAEKQIALVQVELGTPSFTNPGRVSGSDTGFKVFLVLPPKPPASAWVTTHDPGSDCAAFTFSGKLQMSESRKVIDTNGSGGASSSYRAETTVTLTSPPEKPTALQQIQVGYIQHGSGSGSATYATSPAGGMRTLTIPTTNTLDWLQFPCHPGAGEDWPWYDADARDTGSGSGTWSTSLTLRDAPVVSIPAQYNPNYQSDANHGKDIISAAGALAFVIRIAARTSDPDLGADQHYFDEGNSTWTVNFVWPVTPGISIVTTGAGWSTPGGPSEVDVNVIPMSTNENAPFLRWIPS